MDYMFKSGVCRSDITLGSIHSNNSARDSVRGGGGRPTVLLFRARGKRERERGKEGPLEGRRQSVKGGMLHRRRRRSGANFTN